MNRVVLIGRWTKDLQLRFTPGTGTAVATGILAIDRRFKKEGQQDADFVPIVIWGKQAENATTYTGKGKLCGIAGRIQTRNYEAKDGTKRYVTEIVADEVQFLEWINNKNSQPGNEDFNEDIYPVNDGDVPF
ncbi:single-stranded DNA-binding protein [Clostridium cochlearium]|uniref:single-stranded DNA-binding protein n=1 Tax=Clostridium cochlearium TaxID=1494 RepID=UPI000BBC556A|nr:single-stranded DNA-binding protein [Clostridium cochlearium]